MLKELFMTYLKGMIIRRTAFSWTCHPNIKAPKAHSTRQRTKWRGLCGHCHNFISAGCKKRFFIM
jgi:hypothetical protein